MSSSKEWLVILKGAIIGVLIGLSGGSVLYVKSGNIPVFTTIFTGISVIWGIFSYIMYRDAKKTENENV